MERSETMQNSLNLLDEPWLKVSDKDGRIDTVSLIDLFKHAQDYRQLAGEMPAQDLAILRFLLAILLTVYSRYDANGRLYDWVDVNTDTMEPIIGDEDEQEDLLDDYADNQGALYQTWATLYEKKQFSDVVIQYLEKHRDRFNLFDDKYPFYQAPLDFYNQSVPANKQIKDSKTPGEVAIKLLNRTIAESNNSLATYASRADSAKNDITTDEMVRWMITYQNYSGVSDKTTVKRDSKIKGTAAGWLFSIHPVYIKGDDLFDTLMLNLTLTTDNHASLIERPVWEQSLSEYRDKRTTATMPDNLAELYTLWCRLLYLKRDENGELHLFAAKFPRPDSGNSFIEPMTTWKFSSKNKTYFAPAFSSDDLQKSMWANFGEYISTDGSGQTPGVVSWAKALQKHQLLPRQKPIELVTTGFLKDNNASSQMPVYQVYDELKLPADVIFDPKMAHTWPERIKDAVWTTRRAIGAYNSLACVVGGFNGFTKRTGLSGFVDQRVKQVYTQMNVPFSDWLSSLKADDDRDKKVQEWYRTARQILHQACQEALASASPEQFHKSLKPNDFLTAKAHTKVFGKEPKSLFEVVNYYWHTIKLILPVASNQKEDG